MWMRWIIGDERLCDRRFCLSGIIEPAIWTNRKLSLISPRAKSKRRKTQNFVSQNSNLLNYWAPLVIRPETHIDEQLRLYDSTLEGTTHRSLFPSIHCALCLCRKSTQFTMFTVSSCQIIKTHLLPFFLSSFVGEFAWFFLQDPMGCCLHLYENFLFIWLFEMLIVIVYRRVDGVAT